MKGADIMMDHMRTLLSYTLATMAGICFIGGR